MITLHLELAGQLVADDLTVKEYVNNGFWELWDQIDEYDVEVKEIIDGLVAKSS